MRILTRGTLQAFWTRHPEAEPALKAWFAEVEHAAWNGPQDIKARYRTADFLSNNRVVFNIGGNKYRLIVQVKYRPLFCVYVRFVGTHAEYDSVDAEKV